MKKDGEEILLGASLSMGSLCRKVIGSDIEGRDYKYIYNIYMIVFFINKEHTGPYPMSWP